MIAEKIQRGLSHTQANEPNKYAGGAQLTDFKATADDNPDPLVMSDDKPAIKKVDSASQWNPLSTFHPDQDIKEHIEDNNDLEVENAKNVEQVKEFPNMVKLEEVKVEEIVLSVQQNVCTICKLLQVLLHKSSSHSEQDIVIHAIDV